MGLFLRPLVIKRPPSLTRHHIVPASAMPSGRSGTWAERLLAPIKFGIKELVPTVVRLGGAMTVSAAGRRVMADLGFKLAAGQMRYQAAAKAATGAVANWGKHAVLEVGHGGTDLHGYKQWFFSALTDLP